MTDPIGDAAAVIARSVRDYVRRQSEPFLARLDDIEARGPIKGEKGDAGEPGRDGRDGVNAKGVPGRDGRDGFDDLDLEAKDGGRIVRVVLRSGETTVSKEIRLGVLLDRGVWKQGRYERGDGVTYGGSYWIAQADTEATPSSSPDWRLAVKKGRDREPA